MPSITAMHRPRPDLADTALPPALIYGAAILCGVVAALKTGR